MKKYRDFFWFGCAALITLLSLAAAVALYPHKAHSEMPDGQPICSSFKKVIGALEQEYGEQMIGAGISSNNDYIYQLLMHRTGQTWSLIRTDKKGITCFIATGSDWNEVHPWMVRPQSIHGTESWVQKYTTQWSQVQKDDYTWMDRAKNGEGIGCCGRNDVVEISQADANQASIGSVITAVFDGQELHVTVTAIYPTEDRRGRAFLSRFGCIFRQFGM